jgi:adenosylcobyric acid synthase
MGLVINRFRGDPDLFDDGIRILEEQTGLPVLALLPHVEHGLDEEDRPFRIPIDEVAPAGLLKVGAVLYPRVSNTEDLASLLAEPDLHLTWITDPRRVADLDLILLPGSKATVGDLAQITASGLSQAIREASALGAWVLGLCGGYQMLGQELSDPVGSEGGPSSFPGLGMLPLRTEFRAEKLTRESRTQSAWPEMGHELSGYEIHHGSTRLLSPDGLPLADGGAEIGWVRDRVVGAYLHGLLASDAWRSAFLNQVRMDRGYAAQPVHTADPLEMRIQRWAAHLQKHLRPDAWQRILAFK